MKTYADPKHCLHLLGLIIYQVPGPVFRIRIRIQGSSGSGLWIRMQGLNGNFYNILSFNGLLMRKSSNYEVMKKTFLLVLRNSLDPEPD